MEQDNFFLSLYEDYINKGYITPHYGLCNLVKSESPDKLSRRKYLDILDQFRPTEKDSNKLEKKKQCNIFWGHEGNYHTTPEDKLYSEFTPLRQTILLMCHEALNNPLNEKEYSQP